MKISAFSRIIVFILICGLAGGTAFGQKKPGKVQSAKPKQKGQHFSTAWVWDFSNEFDDTKGEMTVYVDTLSGTFLFTKEAYGNSDMNADFVIAGPDGFYYTALTDETGKKSMEIDTVEEVATISASKNYYDVDFAKRVVPTSEKKIFGTNSEKWPVINGEAYKTTFEPPTSFSIDYLVKTNISLLPMYFFNQRPMARTRLPYSFSGALHMNYLLLENTYESDGKKLTIMLRNVMPADKTVDIEAYKK